MKYFQKLGKALMLPVATLPICGILMGIGYWLCPSTMQGGEVVGLLQTIGFLLVKAGSALIDNMAILFAIGVGLGMSDDSDGVGGLAGMVSYLMMTTLLNPGVVGTIMTLEEGTEKYIAFSKVGGNQFIGILAGVIGATCLYLLLCFLYGRLSSADLLQLEMQFSRWVSLALVFIHS